jgi:hypothetical protein
MMQLTELKGARDSLLQYIMLTLPNVFPNIHVSEKVQHPSKTQKHENNNSNQKTQNKINPQQHLFIPTNRPVSSCVFMLLSFRRMLDFFGNMDIWKNIWDPVVDFIKETAMD